MAVEEVPSGECERTGGRPVVVGLLVGLVEESSLSPFGPHLGARSETT
jgi:hypothetical protein